MEILSSEVVGGLIGLGLAIKGIAEWTVRKKSSIHSCPLTEDFIDKMEDWMQRVDLQHTEIITILRERK